jgi:hypothetical protein
MFILGIGYGTIVSLHHVAIVACKTYDRIRTSLLAQAMDLAGLQKMAKETIIMVLSVLSFLCFGYATE